MATACWNKHVCHDDIIKWKHFPHYWPFVRGFHPSPVNSHHKGQWLGALMFSLICTWINAWVNNHKAGDLRCHRAHYDVIVMCISYWDIIVGRLLYPLLQQSWKRGILISLFSVCLSVRPSVHPSICGWKGFYSVYPTILARSISFLHILTTNFRRCVMCYEFFQF